MSKPLTAPFDYVLVGGGLQNALIAMRLLAQRPGVRLALVERSKRLGGNHTWAFHAGDLTPSMQASLAPLLSARWSGYDVAFPDRMRTVARDYAALVSERLHEWLLPQLQEARGVRLLLGTDATLVEDHWVQLANGETLVGRAVIDARGPDQCRAPRLAGYQKFCGLELRLAAPVAPTRPTLMDALVPQTGGFRFFYVLPLAPDRVLVEDTYYATQPALDETSLAAGILAYAEAKGWPVAQVLRQEAGVLPLPASLAPAASNPAILAGYAGGFFHPTTGYSFPVAARLAEAITAVPPAEAATAVARLKEALRPQTRFALRLNRLMFGAFADSHRWRVLSHFYRLPEETIERFYAMTTTPADRWRVFWGRPPRGFSFTRVLTAGGLT